MIATRPGIVLMCVVLCACGEPPPADAPVLRLGDVLGGDDTSGYLRADAPRQFVFPADHGPHPGFRNEWWYFTGNLTVDGGRRFGYQLTFFNGALRPPGGDALPSAWDSERLWMAHLAVTDVASGKHVALERFARESPGLAGADANRVWLEDWVLHMGGDGMPWRIDAADADSGTTLSLTLEPRKPPVLQGHEGLSQKSPDPGNASYYYSLTRVATRGNVTMDGIEFRVTGESWLDREWSTSALAADQSGWNWFSLQFDDGTELMYYQLLDQAGNAHASSAGNRTDADANQHYLSPADVVLTPLESWTAPSGVSYPVAWEFSAAERTWHVRAVLADQWMDVSLPYWEGAVDVMDASDGTIVGHGYLEMVRQGTSE